MSTQRKRMIEELSGIIREELESKSLTIEEVMEYVSAGLNNYSHEELSKELTDRGISDVFGDCDDEPTRVGRHRP